MARARRGSGSARQRPDGVWEFRTSVDGRPRSFYGRTLAEARAKASDGRPQRGSGPTLGEWLAEWLAGQQGRLRPQTWRRYEQLMRLHVLPHLGGSRLAGIRERDLDGLGASVRASGLGETTTHHVLVVLGTALRAAQARGLLARAPAVGAPRMRHRAKVVLSRDEAARVIAAAADSPVGAAYVLALTIGARSGELRALRWRDVDLDAGTVTIRGSVVTGYGGSQEIDDPKTKAGRRTVRIPPVAVEALRRTPVVGSLVLGGDRPIAASTLLRAGVFEASGLPPMPFHDLRHTAATHMLEDGVPAHVVARVLGHANVGVTLSIYAHVTGAMTEAAVDAMAARYPVVGSEVGSSAEAPRRNPLRSNARPRSSVDRAEVS